MQDEGVRQFGACAGIFRLIRVGFSRSGWKSGNGSIISILTPFSTGDRLSKGKAVLL